MISERQKRNQGTLRTAKADSTESNCSRRWGEMAQPAGHADLGGRAQSVGRARRPDSTEQSAGSARAAQREELRYLGLLLSFQQSAAQTYL